MVDTVGKFDSLRSGEAGPVLAGTPGHVLTIGPDGRSVSPEAAAGGGLQKTSLTLATFDVVIPTSSIDGELVAWSNHVAADFALEGDGGLWSLGDAGALTYSGPAVVAVLLAQACIATPGGGGVGGVLGFAMALDGDLIGDSPSGPPATLAGSALAQIQTEANGVFGIKPVSAFRRVSLVPGSVVQPVAGLQQNIASQDCNLEAFALMLLY